MDLPARSRDEAGSHGAPDTSEMHNASVDEDVAAVGLCAQVHLATGRTCTLPHGHQGSCDFVPAGEVDASVAARQAHMSPTPGEPGTGGAPSRQS